MKNSRLVAGLAAAVLWLVGVDNTLAEPKIALQFNAVVTEVQDVSGALQGAIYVGQTLTGNLTLSAQGTNFSSIAKVGAYEFTSSPSSLSIQAGAVTFAANPDNLRLRVEVLNNVADGIKENRDTFLFRSYKNLPILGGLPVDDISWQVDDFSSTAVSNVALPVDAPILSKYRSVFGLVMAGQDPDDPTLSYLVRAKVTSISKQQ